MGDVLTFTPRPKPAAPETLEPLVGATLRASLEEAAQVALDAANRIIAVLDRMDGDTDIEDSADAEPSLAAPENHTGSQVVWMCGNDADCEIEAPEAVLPEVANVNEVEPLRWGWAGQRRVGCRFLPARPGGGCADADRDPNPICAPGSSPRPLPLLAADDPVLLAVRRVDDPRRPTAARSSTG